MPWQGFLLQQYVHDIVEIIICDSLCCCSVDMCSSEVMSDHNVIIIIYM